MGQKPRPELEEFGGHTVPRLRNGLGPRHPGSQHTFWRPEGERTSTEDGPVGPLGTHRPHCWSGQKDGPGALRWSFFSI